MSKQIIVPGQQTRQRFRLPNKQVTVHNSFWFLLGFGIWVGFFIGAVILHALTK